MYIHVWDNNVHAYNILYNEHVYKQLSTCMNTD